MISVIVPAYNAARTLGACLDALERQTMPRERYEIILVDDSSTDDTAQMAARYAGVKVLRLTRNQGAAAARNAGIAAAQGELLLFTDADCIPCADWVAEMVKPFADQDIAGGKGVYHTKQRALVARFVQLEYESRYARMQGRRYIDFIDTYAAVYRREVLAQVGGFDPRVRFVEDQELSFRAARAGYHMVFIPTAVVYHLHPETLRRYLLRKARIGYWKAWVVRHHPGKAIEDAHTPQGLKLELALVAVALLSLALSPLYAPALLVALGAFCLLLLLAWPFTHAALRRDRAVGLISPPLLILRAVALGLGLTWGLVSLALGIHEADRAGRTPSAE